MLKSGLMVQLEAAPGKEAEVERMLTGLLTRVHREAGTRVWMALRLSPTSFGIVSGFPDPTARNAHLAGEVAARLKDASEGLLGRPPEVKPFDVMAFKMPK